MQGLSMLIVSSVPEGKGVSSSAAVGVAAMRALLAAHGVTLPGRELAILCQKVENLVVGAPCGIMDQAYALQFKSLCARAIQGTRHDVIAVLLWCAARWHQRWFGRASCSRCYASPQRCRARCPSPRLRASGAWTRASDTPWAA
jgi:hypothetical protein